MNAIYTRLNFAYYVLDVLVILLALVGASELREVSSFGIPGPEGAFDTPTFLYVVAPILWLFSFHKMEAYTQKLNARLSGQVWRLLKGHIMAYLLYLGTLYLTYRLYSRLQALYLFVFILLGALLCRLVLYILINQVFPGLRRKRAVLIVGTNQVAERMGSLIGSAANDNLHLAGYVPLEACQDDGATVSPVLGAPQDLQQIVAAHGVDEVVVAIKWYDARISTQISQVMVQLQGMPVNIRLAPDYSELAFFHQSPENFHGMPLIGLRDTVFSPTQRLVKRTFDIVLASVTLLVGWPILLLVALAIALDSPGPIIIRQIRVGKHGKPFAMYKFRTMYQDTRFVPTVKSRDDPRVTRVGRFLRKLSLDETPQFINVLRGDMSLVGPRPELPERVQYYEWWQSKRFEVPQGMTGWWQINGRANRPMHLHTEDDLFYISNYSLYLDIKIILRTLISVLRGDGAY